MARKSEDGIEYFPVNTDIIHNPKIKLVVTEFGPKAWAVLFPLYCKIYREKGYWIDWMDEDTKLLFATDECKCDVLFVNEVVSGCIRRGLFNKVVFGMFGILTSDRIQGNYYEAKKRNKEIRFINEFLLISDNVYKSNQNVNISPLNVNIIKKIVDISTQKKKEKEILEGEGDGAVALAHSQEDKILFKNFQVWLGNNAPRVNQLKEPLTIDQYLKLRKKLEKDVLCNLLTSMQNYKPLLTKSISAYLTILKWSKNEEYELKPETINGASAAKISEEKARAIINA